MAYVILVGYHISIEEALSPMLGDPNPEGYVSSKGCHCDLGSSDSIMNHPFL